MTDSKFHIPEGGTLEGRTFRPNTFSELEEAVELAFDYRGDVTIELASGTNIEGYVFNRDASTPQPFLQIFPRGQDSAQTILLTDIVSIAFTGKDVASGKSWEAWVAKKESQRRAEAAQAEAEARARGHL